MGWIRDNLGTIVVSAVLVAVVGLIVRKMIRDKRNGKKSCGGGCQACPFKDSCHEEKKE